MQEKKEKKMNHNSTPLLRGNTLIPQPISLPCGSPSHWDNHSNPVDSSLSQLNSCNDVCTSDHIPCRIDEHRGNPLCEDPFYRSIHPLLPSLILCSTRHNS